VHDFEPDNIGVWFWIFTKIATEMDGLGLGKTGVFE
jgi:hypothetical protein